ncbi:MAG: carbohydrate kinase [Ferruginibacter sp.]
MKKILCIGEALIDMICTNKGTALSDGNDFVKKPGGAPTNVAAAIAALGGKVELAAKVGVDPFGKHLLNVMKGFGVGTKHMLQTEKHFTTFAFVSLMQNGERDFYFNRGADAALTEADCNKIPLDNFSIVHFGSATGFLKGSLQKAYSTMLKKTGKKGLFISFDPNYRHLLFKNNTKTFVTQSWKFMTACDFFKVSDEEALLLTGKKSVADAAAVFVKKTKAVFTITLGKEGTLLGLNGQTCLVPSIKIEPTDTTGAGDAFVGAVLYQLSNKSTAQIKKMDAAAWQSIIANANKAGARTCEYLGAMEAFKHLNKDIFN